MKKINKINKRRTLALSQIFILVIGIIAVSYALGSEMGVVSGQESCTKMSTSSEIGKDGKPYFCYGGTSGIKKYTVENATKIVREDSWWYTKEGDIWKWHKPGGGEGVVTQDTEGTFFSQWNKLTSEATKLYQAGERKFPTQTEAYLKYLSSLEKGTLSTTHDPAAAGGVGQGTGAAELEALTEQEEPKVPPDASALTWAGAWTSLKGIVLGAGIAYATYEGIKFILPVIGIDEKFVEPIALAMGIGYFFGHGTVSLFKEGGLLATEGLEFLGTPWGGVAVGAVAAFIVLLASKVKTDQEIITFTCQPWDAPTGGNKCDDCNKQGILPCSEYQCRSLGQACELVNPGTDEEKCVWVNRNDVEFPTIEALEDALLEDYSYVPTNKISPPDRGVLISYDEAQSTKIVDDKNIGCIEAFTPLAFGIKTNEPAKCKLDVLRKDKFDDMNFYFSGGLFKTEHSYALSLPGAEALEAEGIEITGEGGIQELYVRCQDANGNSNPATFVFKFCVDEGPDETPPLIVTTDLINNMPVAFGQTSINVNVYTNEPLAYSEGGCKWSHNDQGYENMENGMTCDTSLSSMNSQGLFTCRTTLDGLKDGVKNRFYFRCKDKAGNTNIDSYEFTLMGTQPLVIDSVSPNETTVKDSTDPVKVTIDVKTSAGYDEGKATCYYSDTGDEKDYVQFLETVSYQHSQDLWLPGGKSYTYDIKCIDLGGNADYSTISFEVETDIEAPVVVRAYHEDTYLKIVTNEKAECVYDVTNCDYAFEDGISMASADDGISHFTDWNTKLDFHIKCRDAYGKQPNPNECSIIARPLQIL